MVEKRGRKVVKSESQQGGKGNLGAIHAVAPHELASTEFRPKYKY